MAKDNDSLGGMLVEVGRCVLMAAAGDESALEVLLRYSMFAPNKRLSDSLYTIYIALTPKTKRGRGRKPTPNWQANVAWTAALLGRCGMDPAEAKRQAAIRRGRNLRSVQRYIAKNGQAIENTIDLMIEASRFHSRTDWQKLAKKYRLHDDETRQLIDHILSRQKQH